MRGGYADLAEYGEAINELTRNYFVNPARNWSAERIVQSGFNDEDIRHLPYQRGALYFADLDARIRAKSDGEQNLESLLFPLFEAREQGMTFDHARWIALVTEELGPTEAERFESLILAGSATLQPAEGAFGPCFKRRATTFEVGGQSIAGFEWVRVPSKPDEQCRR